MCAYTRNNRLTIVRIVSLNVLGNGTPRSSEREDGWTTQGRESSDTHLSCWGRRIRRRGGLVPSSSVRRRTPVQGAWSVAYTSRRLPIGTRIYKPRSVNASRTCKAQLERVPGSSRHDRALLIIHAQETQSGTVQWYHAPPERYRTRLSSHTACSDG